ncbi:MAG: YicC/YloC family endoribonuclease [Legionella sp.]
MTSSMTAFSSLRNQVDSNELCWELKSVNHRYLDISFRLPESLRFLESKLREKLRQQMSRGKIECSLKVQNLSGHHQQVSIDADLVKECLAAGAKLAYDNDLLNDLSLSKLILLPGIMQIVPPDLRLLNDVVVESFSRALSDLQLARLTEGRALKECIQERLVKFNIIIRQVCELVKPIAAETRDKLMTRLQDLQVGINQPRLEQEIALIIVHKDINEEIDRLQMHLNEVERALASSQPVGRRLDFLMQELNREANTLSSKSDRADLTLLAVEMKVLIEQMREQIQNIE